MWNPEAHGYTFPVRVTDLTRVQRLGTGRDDQESILSLPGWGWVAVDESVKMRMTETLSVWKCNHIKDLCSGARKPSVIPLMRAQGRWIRGGES